MENLETKDAKVIEFETKWRSIDFDSKRVIAAHILYQFILIDDLREVQQLIVSFENSKEFGDVASEVMMVTLGLFHESQIDSIPQPHLNFNSSYLD